MLRTLFTVGIMAVVGLCVLRLAFGLFGVVLGLFFSIVWIALRLLVVGAIVYFVIRVVSPSTARELRERFGR
ncbi:MAG: hypothetical protein NTU67_05645 [Gemmatimonadetes bacterium]|jgi:hypothetical protein|nr:hypothetical protein [Gemmatimonadota bacterium]